MRDIAFPDVLCQVKEAHALSDNGDFYISENGGASWSPSRLNFDVKDVSIAVLIRA